MKYLIYIGAIIKNLVKMANHYFIPHKDNLLQSFFVAMRSEFNEIRSAFGEMRSVFDEMWHTIQHAIVTIWFAILPTLSTIMTTFRTILILLCESLISTIDIFIWVFVVTPYNYIDNLFEIIISFVVTLPSRFVRSALNYLSTRPHILHGFALISYAFLIWLVLTYKPITIA